MEEFVTETFVTVHVQNMLICDPCFSIWISYPKLHIKTDSALNKNT
jgi:hypothetical protein